MKMFDAALKSLIDTAKMVDACGKLLPLMLKALGIAAEQTTATAGSLNPSAD